MEPVKEFVEAVFSRVAGPWILSVVLIVGGIFLLQRSLPELHAAGSLAASISASPHPWVEILLPSLGVVLTGSGLLVGVRQQKIESRRRSDEEALGKLSQEFAQLHEELKTHKNRLRALGDASLSQQKQIASLTVLAIRGREREALTHYLDTIVGLCKEKYKEKDYRFWVKIYQFKPDIRALEPMFRSSEAPEGVGNHRLELGKGAAGSFAKRFLENPDVILAAECFGEQEIRSGLTAHQIRELDEREVRTVLCAAITAQVPKVQDDGAIHYQTVIRNGRPSLLGVLCFCSTLGRRESTLTRQSKMKACQEAANLTGWLFHKFSIGVSPHSDSESG